VGDSTAGVLLTPAPTSSCDAASWLDAGSESNREPAISASIAMKLLPACPELFPLPPPPRRPLGFESSP
jgi:hypothetical protein